MCAVKKAFCSSSESARPSEPSMKPAIISHSEAMWSSGSRTSRVALDAEPAHVLAQLGERLLVQEAGEIVGAVGDELAADEADEELVVLLGDGRRLRARAYVREGCDARPSSL